MMALFPILLSTAVIGAAFGLITPAFALILAQQGVSPALNGLQTAVMYVALAIAAPLMGRAIAHHGAKRVLVAGLLATGAATVGFAVCSWAPGWLLLRVLLGAGMAAVYVGTETMINLVSPPTRRSRNLGLYGLAFALGLAVGSSGLVAQHAGYLRLLLVGGGVAGLAAAVAGFGLRSPQILLLAPQNRASGWPRVGAPGLAAAVYGFTEAAVLSLLPVYALHRGLAPAVLAPALSAFALGGTLLAVPIGMVGDRWGKGRVLVGIAVAGAVLFPAAGLATGWAFAGWLALAGGALGGLYPLGLALLAEQRTPQQLPAANGIYTALYSVGSICGPLAPGLLMQLWRPEALFVALTAAHIALALVSARASRATSG